jgi:phosphoribosylanthranilate isomerase
MIIKASSIANLTDARYFAAKEVAFLGFCLDENGENYLQPMVVKALKEWIEGPSIVGEFGMQSTKDILAKVSDIGLDAVQLSFFSAADSLALRTVTSVFREIVVEKNTRASELWEHLEHFGSMSDALILDFEKNNITWQDIVKSQEFSIDLLQRACQKYKVFLAINFQSIHLQGIIKALNPEGISLKGGDEEKVGLKSFDELDDIFDALEEL